jgi:hypothetical protein
MLAQLTSNASAPNARSSTSSKRFFSVHQITTTDRRLLKKVVCSEWNLLPSSPKRRIVRVVTIKHPPDAIEGMRSDNSTIGTIYDLPPQLAILMIAAGWVRSDTRSRVRRHRDLSPSFNRREHVDRRSVAAA